MVLAGLYSEFLVSLTLCSLCLQGAEAVQRPLPGGVAQTCIAEKSGPLVLLTGLDCCSFVLILVIRRGGTKKGPMGATVFQTYMSLSH